ncbi:MULTISPECIES: Rpn family recombination-promoting nuclease/putative transposase [Megamonas]|uniref:Rpn family recombination-promoting nuclease/putative transposase n=1 Tax=Megamonas TaxID=158846 RepID=UPI000E4015CF|nr:MULTISPECIES: Rpn family recombination-promoting nuclease/putative transposase [Megamonas]RGO06087.1 Rpn family recombination-promoting nuclease/putative transposase [Megamonas rupellensis]
MTKQKRKVYRLNDFFFKNLMGDEKRSNLTLRFLNLILNRTGEDAFKSIQFLKTEQDPLTKDGKLSILDVKASVDDKTFVNIELQVSRQNYIVERSMFYISRIFSEQAVRGHDYDELKPVIGINLLDFKLFDELSNWHNTANFTVKGIEKPITDCLTRHFLELPKLKFSDVKKAKRLEAWGAYFSGVSDEKELEVLCMNEPLLKEVLSYEQAFTNNDEMYRKYQQREDAIREETTKIRLGEKRGEKRGIIIGRKEGKKEQAEAMAKKMLADKVDLKIIAKYTELTLDEINALKMNI